MFIYQLSLHFTSEYCYMHFNNYFVEHIGADIRWGITCYFHGLQWGKPYRNFDLSNTFFPLPLYMNNDRSLVVTASQELFEIGVHF